MAPALHMKGLSDEELETIVSRAWAATFDDKPDKPKGGSTKEARVRASGLVTKVRINRPPTLRPKQRNT